MKILFIRDIYENTVFENLRKFGSFLCIIEERFTEEKRHGNLCLPFFHLKARPLGEREAPSRALCGVGWKHMKFRTGQQKFE